MDLGKVEITIEYKQRELDIRVSKSLTWINFKKILNNRVIRTKLGLPVDDQFWFKVKNKHIHIEGNDILANYPIGNGDKAENKVTVQVSSSGYDRERLDAIKEYCRVAIRQEDVSLYLDYEIPAYFKTVTEELLSLKTELERFALAQKMTSIELGENNFKIPYIHPENIVILGGKVKMLHLGIEKLLSPRIYDEEFCLASYKALMVSILVPKVDFELAVSGLDAVKDKIAQDIIPLRTLEEINQYVSEKYYTLSKKSSIENILVNTKKWKGLLIATSVLAVVSAVLSFTTYQSMFKDGPLKSAVIMAQSNFMRKDFSETVESLKAYSVDSLPKEAKYILAASYVRLDSLSDKQKETVLNTITESSDDTMENLKRHWM